MANRYMQQFFYSFNHGITFLEGSFTVGASGAVGTVKGSGIASVTKNSTGNYTIALEDKYMKFLGANFNLVAASYSGIATVEVADTSIDTHVQDGTGIQVVCYDGTGTAANPASGAIVYFSIVLRNSSIKGKGE